MLIFAEEIGESLGLISSTETRNRRCNPIIPRSGLQFQLIPGSNPRTQSQTKINK